MKYFILLLLSLETAVFCAMVKELPFPLDVSEIEENVTSIEEVTAMATLFSEVFDQLIHLEDEPNQTIPEASFNWTSSEGTPILSALRNFWAQAKTGLLMPMEPLSEEAINDNKEHFVKAIEHGLMEATTMLSSRIEETTLATSTVKELESASESTAKDLEAVSESTAKELEAVSESTAKELDAISKSTAFSKRQGQEMKPSEKISTNNKRQTAFDLMANMSSSCSNCYEKLQSCIQRCFVENDCNDVQRSVRTCPPVPNRLCNFFTQWNPVDECVNHSDCKSPLLCCNDGCGHKCVSGVWHS